MVNKPTYAELEERLAQVEIKLAEQHEVKDELFRELVETTSAVAWELNLATLKFTYISPNIEKLTGYPASSWQDLDSWASLIHPDDREYAVTFCMEETARGQDHEFEYRLMTDNGRYIWIREIVTLVWDKGNVVALRGYLFDTTKYVEADEKRKESEQRFRNLVETTTDWIWEMDRKGVYTYSSPQVENILGYSPEEIVGKAATSFMPKKEPERVMRTLQPLITSQKPINFFENVIRHKKGFLVLFETNGVPFYDEHGDLLGYRGTCRDITERKTMENEAQKARNLKSLGILAGGIAHDFNNLLTAVFGNIDLALLHLKRGEEYKAAELLGGSIKAMDRARSLTGQLLTFAKGGDPVKETVDLSQLISDASTFLLSGSKVRCQRALSTDLWPVEIDKGQMEQVFYNVLLNAKEAMPEGGTVHIAAENKEFEKDFESLGAGRYVKISIQDEGRGIPKRIVPRIFDPYFSTKQMGRNAGTGLGLAICHSIISKHGGQIMVEQGQEGGGACFYLYLPVSNRRVSAGWQKTGEGHLLGGSKGNILLMDDEDEVLDIAGKMIGFLGYDHEIARDGDAAIFLYKEGRKRNRPFDVVLIDLTIKGGKGGEETIKELLALDPAVMAVVVSGYADDIIMSNYKAYGFKDAIAKPFAINTLGKVLEELLGESGNSY